MFLCQCLFWLFPTWGYDEFALRHSYTSFWWMYISISLWYIPRSRIAQLLGELRILPKVVVSFYTPSSSVCEGSCYFTPLPTFGVVGLFKVLVIQVRGINFVMVGLILYLWLLVVLSTFFLYLFQIHIFVCKRDVQDFILVCFLWLHQVVCGILVPSPRIEPMLPAL